MGASLAKYLNIDVYVQLKTSPKFSKENLRRVYHCLRQGAGVMRVARRGGPTWTQIESLAASASFPTRPSATGAQCFVCGAVHCPGRAAAAASRSPRRRMAFPPTPFPLHRRGRMRHR